MLEQATEQASTRAEHKGGSLLDFYVEEFRPEVLSPDSFRQRVSDWFFATKHLRRFESTRLLTNPAPADLATHRLVVDALIAFGQFASDFARTQKVDLRPINIVVESIEAETSFLKYRIEMYHEPTMPSAEAERLLKEIFP
jgi:hypothetical protein